MVRGVSLAAAALAIGCQRGGGPVVRFAGAEEVSTATPVGTTPMFAVSPAGTQALAWVSAPDSGADGTLFVSVGGAPAVQLTDPLGPIEAHGESPPKLAYSADGALNALYVVPRVVAWKRFPLAALRFTRSTDGGKTWSPPVSVTDEPAFARRHNFHALYAAPDGSLYVSWLDDREGKAAPYVTRSSDGGRTWSPNRRVGTGEACPCCRTALTSASDGTLFIAWRQVLSGNVRDIVVSRSNDQGVTWTAPVRVHADDWVYGGCPHAGPSIQVDAANRLHVAWWTGKEGAAGVYYARSTDGERSFSQPVPLGVAQYSQPAHVQMALGTRGEVVIAWDDGTREMPEVIVRVSRDDGATFGPSARASAPGRAAQFPVLAVTDSTITVAWSEESAAAREADARRKAARPKNMPMGHDPIGDAHVAVRRGRIS
ncbi:MAG TPA: sialidase family protein [Gemmatimonadales bacterium]|nr:sialidase family protein [Gemmatimonadales bacterium]